MYEEIKNQSKREFFEHKINIFQDCLFIYGATGPENSDKPTKNELWSVDLKKHTWKLCETTGGAPGKNPSRNNSSKKELEEFSFSLCFIFQDYLCVCQTENFSLFMLNLSQ